MRRYVRLSCVLLALGFIHPQLGRVWAQQPSPLVTAPVDNSVRFSLRGNVHPLARAQYDQGAAPDTLALSRMLLVLRRTPQQESSLRSLLQAQQNRNSQQFRQWLTPQQFGALFGPSDSDLAAVTDWLRASGFTIARVSASRTFIEFSGNAGLVRQAFQTTIHRYAVNGQSYWANSQEPSVPAALAPLVAAIDSLNSFPRAAQNLPAKRNSTSAVASSPVLSPDYTFQQDGYSQYVVTPFDFATIYDLLPLWNATPAVNGTGETIAIVGRSDIKPANVTSFWNLFGLDGTHAPQPKLVITYDGSDPGYTADELEADADAEWSGAAAPGATINLVVSASTETTDGVDLSALYIVDNNIAPIMTVSFGECETSLGVSGVQLYGSLWEQAAAQGISVFVASGDSGAAGCDSPGGTASQGLNVNGLASTPFNVAVGGTDFNEYNTWSNYWAASNAPVTNESAIGYIPETSWNDSCVNPLLQYLPPGTTNAEANCNNSTFDFLDISAAGGGGSSTSWMKPEWQTGTLSDNARDLPDISLFASDGVYLGSSYVVCQTGAATPCGLGSLTRVGGTSLPTPAMAGIMALVDQETGAAQGDPAIVLYKLAAHQTGAFHDVPAGTTIAVPCVTGSPNCTTNTTGDKIGITSGYNTAAGYDLATGIGSVDAAKLANGWNTISFTPSATTLSLNGGAAITAVHGASVPVSISVNPSAATGDASLIISPAQPGAGIANFTLSSGAYSGNTALLPGGSYSVEAHYQGDPNYGGSYSNSVPVNITPENSVVLPHLVSLNVSGNITSYAAAGGTYGNGFFIFRVDVGDSSTAILSTGVSSHCLGRTSSCPTGTVTLHAPGTPLDGTMLNLNSLGYAEIQSIVAGTYSVTAIYSGDASYAPSTAIVNFTIAKAPTTTTVAALGTPVQYGNQEEVAAAALTNSTGVAPTGSFQIYVDGQPDTAPLDFENSAYLVANNTNIWASADATSTYTFLSVGQHTLSATYSGDANYLGSSISSVSVSVTPAQPTFNGIGWGTPNLSVPLGQQTAASADLIGSTSGALPTGTVTFFDNGVPIAGTVTYSSPYTHVLQAAIPYTLSSYGSHALGASYSGDANYLAATSSASQAVDVLGPFTATSGSIGVSSPGQTGNTNITLTSNFGFTGTVTLSCAAPAAATGAACAFGPTPGSGSSTQVTLSANAAAVTPLTITTTAPQLDASISSWKALCLSLAFLCALFLPLRRARLRLGLASLAVIMLFASAGCGSGGAAITSGGASGGSGTSGIGTSPGSYSFTVTATSGTGSSAFSTAVQVPVIVN